MAAIKVVDLTRYFASPFCTQILGDYGAEIFKIEPVENPRGELGQQPKVPTKTAFFLSTNRSSKSLRLDIKKPRGREILMRLVEDAADVLVDNFRPGVMQALGSTTKPCTIM